MRITLESTNSSPEYSMKSVVEVPYDDVELSTLFNLVDQLLRGYGFSWDDDDDSNKT